ncbi:hypothetical protein C8A05DRAFT_32121 [Staphylotrichum tortipilum]|uniref:Uncharacterized protein n=1 Tax=Staphylotrichum tortipilum TaxID=2831512 RepID=A0AAN6RUP3_9PEZI|nr:hypothetical protein C8A05DRAFT_32121 [Staphylotrichum longicolle]
MDTKASKLNYFVEALSRTVRAHAASTRAHSFPEEIITAPEPGEVALDEKIVVRISSTVRRWRGRRQENPTPAETSSAAPPSSPTSPSTSSTASPETWDATSDRTDETDYRDTRIYQYMLNHCTWGGYTTSEVATHPHRQFFGIADRQFSRNGHDFRAPPHNLTLPYGLVPFAKFLTWDDKTADRRPGIDDVPAVRRLLHRGLGLPMELVLEILALAEYEPRGRLRVPHDPFHRANREELEKYLKYCWGAQARARDEPWFESVWNIQ